MVRNLSFPKESIWAAFIAVWASSLLGVLVTWSSPWGSVRPLDLALAAWCVTAIPSVLSNWKQRRGQLLTALPFLAWLGLATVLWGNDPALGLIYLARWSALIFTVFTMTRWLQELPAKESALAQSVLDIWSLAFVAFGLLQYLLLPDARHLYWLGWDDHLFRAFGTVLDPLFFGLVASLVAWRGWRRRTDSPKVAILLLSFGLLASVVSFSRLALLAVGVWLVLETLTAKSIRRTGIVGVMLVALVLFIPKDGGGEGQKLLRTASLEARVTAGQQDAQTPRSWQQYVTGSGWYIRQTNNQSALPQNARLADSLWLQLWLSGGSIGFLLLGWGMWRSRPLPEIFHWHTILNVFSLASLSPFVGLASVLVSKTGKFQLKKSSESS